MGQSIKSLISMQIRDAPGRLRTPIDPESDGARPQKLMRPKREPGGEGGIRTRDTLASMPHFECGAFNHSATSPRPIFIGPFEGSSDHHHIASDKQVTINRS